MKKKVKLLIGMIVVISVVAVCLIYTRPMSISQLYPMLSLDKCTEIHGWFRVDAQELSEFSVGRDGEDFKEFCGLFYDRSYKQSLKDIFPRGTQIHPIQPGDFEWKANFTMEGIEFPNGNTGSGDILQIDFWYGELTIRCDGEEHIYKTTQQTSWAADVLNLILENQG